MKYAFQLQYKKNPHCSSNDIYSWFFLSFFWVNDAFVAVMVWLRMVSTSVLLQLYSLLSIELNYKRSSTSLTWGKGSDYLNAFHDIIHIVYMCFLIKIMHNINSLEKCSVEKKNSCILPGLSQIFLSQDFSRLENLYLIIFLVFKLFQCVWEPWERSLLNI